MKRFLTFFSDKRVIIALIFVALVLCVFVGIFVGSVSLSPSEVINALFSGNPDDANFRIIVYVRLPRILGALLAGASLAVAGAVLQTVLDNSLASPGIIGVNAGGGLFYLLAIVIFPSSLIAGSIGAFLGALVAVFTVWIIAYKTGGAKNTIVLAGVAISSLFTAVIDTVVTLKPELSLDRLAFSVGGFENTDYTSLLCALPFCAAGMIVAMLLSYDLNVLNLGDELAAGLGMRVNAVRFAAISSVAALAGGAISVAGLLGFVGLVAPHVVQKFTGKDNRIKIPVSALFGALLTLVCDIIARTAFSPYELPVGILLSFIGVPFFLALLLGKKSKAGRARR